MKLFERDAASRGHSASQGQGLVLIIRLSSDSGIKAHNGNQPRFSFELFWFRQEGFYEMVVKEWNSINTGRNPIERWQNKIRHLRRFLKGWVKSMSGNYKKRERKID
jgi:hypothetical protein